MLFIFIILCYELVIIVLDNYTYCYVVGLFDMKALNLVNVTIIHWLWPYCFVYVCNGFV